MVKALEGRLGVQWLCHLAPAAQPKRLHSLPGGRTAVSTMEKQHSGAVSGECKCLEEENLFVCAPIRVEQGEGEGVL